MFMLPLPATSPEDFATGLAFEYCRTGEAVPVHQARLQLKSFKGALERLLDNGMVRAFGKKLFPGMLVFQSLREADVRIFAIESAEMVFSALFTLYAEKGPGLYSRAEILSATVQPESQFSSRRIRVGMLIVSEFRNYVEEAYPNVKEAGEAIESLLISDHMSEYQSFAQAWQEELQRREFAKLRERRSDKTVFVSCGQVTDAERQLGKSICKLVEELTPFRAYFAENQTSLEALTENILTRLNNCVAFIAVMHPRGDVRGIDDEQRTRGSVWVEQEIAICAFIVQVLKKHLKVAAYIHRSIFREGMRSQLHLNPVLFDSNEDVLSDLRLRLGEWSTETATAHEAAATPSR